MEMPLAEDGPDLLQSFNDSLAHMQQTEKDGGRISTMDKDWGNVYSLMTNPDLPDDMKARLAFQVATSLKPGTPVSDAAWSSFHQDVDQLEQRGDTEKALALMGMAITSESSLSGVRGRTTVETVNNLQNMSDEDLEKLSPDARRALMQQIANTQVSGPMSAEETMYLQQRYQDQFTRLNELEDKDAPGGKKNVDNVSKEWSAHNISRYFDLLDEESKKNLPTATSSLADVMTDPATRGTPQEATMWSVFSDYVARLSNKDPANQEKNIDAADKAIQKAWDALPADDPHRRILENMAANNGYIIEKPKPGPTAEEKKEQQKMDGAMGMALNKASEQGVNGRYAVSDTRGTLSAHLSTPHGQQLGAPQQGIG